MDTSHVTKISDTLNEELAQYGIIRDTAAKLASVNTESANLFGYKNNGADTELMFSDDGDVLVESRMDLAMVAPENESFNMLLTKDFKKAVDSKDEDSLRAFLRRLLDEV